MSDNTVFVLDTNANANHQIRVHEVLNDDGTTTQYEFNYGKKTEMPLHHGLKFLIDPAFVVADADGNRIDPRPRREQEQENALALDPDQTVAKYEELTTAALFVRCKMLAGSDKIKKNTQKGDLIQFLIEAGAKADGVTPTKGGNAKGAATPADDGTAVEVSEDDDMSDIFGDEDDD